MSRRFRSLLRHVLPAATATAMLAGGVVMAAPAQAAGDIDLCVSVGRVAGFTGEKLVTAVAVAMAESACDPKAKYVNDGGSIDRGLWQINDYWHSEVKDDCAYNAQCNANAAYDISDHGNDWTPWSTFNSGRYRNFLQQARDAIGVSAPPLRASKSVNGDKYDDLVAVDSSGVAWVYPGKSTGGFGTRTRLGPGWGGFSKIGVNDANGDGWADLFAVGGNTLYIWMNRGTGTFNAKTTVGTGWSAIEYLSFADVNGDNKADILARDGGNMYAYIGKGTGTFAVRYLLGPGWGTYLRHSASDADADGDGDIWATNGAGDLYYWKRNNESYSSGIDVGSGWNAFRQLTTMDVNGDSRADIVAIKASDNTLWQWFGSGSGTFGQGKSIGAGWGTFQLAAY